MKIPAIFILIIALFFIACTQPPPGEPPDTRAADESAVRAVSKDWAAASRAKDPDEFVSFYAENARLMTEQSPDVIGKAAIREVVEAMMGDPNFALNFETTAVKVARSGDIAYELGSYSMTGTNPNAEEPVTLAGTFVAVWEKQSDGAWKCVLDAPVTNAPPAPPGK